MNCPLFRLTPYPYTRTHVCVVYPQPPPPSPHPSVYVNPIPNLVVILQMYIPPLKDGLYYPFGLRFKPKTCTAPNLLNSSSIHFKSILQSTLIHYHLTTYAHLLPNHYPSKGLPIHLLRTLYRPTTYTHYSILYLLLVH